MGATSDFAVEGSVSDVIALLVEGASTFLPSIVAPCISAFDAPALACAIAFALCC